MTLTVAELGEDQLLARIFPILPAGSATLLGPGDDAAVLAAPDGRFVVSTDVLVEGHHFRLDRGSPEALGRRAAAQNLADVAAMGARPTAITVGLVIPASTPVDWVLGLARGLAEACGPHGVGVVGGDLTGGEQVVVSVTVHGDLEGREPVRRDGACPGDVLALAGTVGRSAAGLALLESGTDDDARWAGLFATHLSPEPPLAAGPAAALAGASSMIDVSDGLLKDAGRVARASEVRIEVDTGALAGLIAPLAEAAAHLGADPLRWVLTGGEDHGLLATFPAGAELPEGFVVLGRVLEGGEEPGVLVDGQAPTGESGWDHFSAS